MDEQELVQGVDMETEFQKVIYQHRQRYLKMEPQDYAKLAYQSEFGPEHMVTDKEQVLSYLRKEWEGLPEDCSSCYAENIGNGLCRLHFGSVDTIDETAPLVAELFFRTAGEHHGSMEGMLERLEKLQELPVVGMKDWLAGYKARNCPPVHHSQVFRDAYHPHYRLIRSEYACYFRVLLAIWRLMQRGDPVIAAIDGRCGSGKTGLAKVIHSVFPCNVFHMDDFYMPLKRRKENWRDIPGGNMDFERFRQEVLLPARNGKTVSYRPFRCRSGELGQAEPVLPCALAVVEGSYSQHPALAGQYDLKIFLTCSKEVQRGHLTAREGAYYSSFEELWIPMEEQYIQSCNIEQKSDICLNTDQFFENLEETV